MVRAWRAMKAEGLDVGPGLVVEAPDRLPEVFQDVDQVADDVDVDAADQGLGLDLRDLRLGAVDEHHPVALMAPDQRVSAGRGLPDGPWAVYGPSES